MFLGREDATELARDGQRYNDPQPSPKNLEKVPNHFPAGSGFLTLSLVSFRKWVATRIVCNLLVSALIRIIRGLHRRFQVQFETI
jgi:hypothetical protein